MYMANGAEESLKRLIEGNGRFLSAGPAGDVSPERRMYTAQNGQHPYAAIVTCSDSRVIPEIIFSAGIGDLFDVTVMPTTGPTTPGRGSEDHPEIGAWSYADRTKDFPYKIDTEDPAYRLFTKKGFIWGGSWKNSKDYQHFEFNVK